MDSDARDSRFRRFLWNASERRPRMPVRLGIGAIVVVAAVAGTTAVIGGAVSGAESIPVLVAAWLAVQGIPGIVVLILAAVVDRRTVADLGLGVDRDWWIDLGVGLGLGATLMTGIFFVALGMEWIRIEGWLALESNALGFPLAFAILLAFFLTAGFTEELVVRGYLLTNLAEGLSGFVSHRVAIGFAVLASSLVFGVGHGLNPNATIVSTVGITIAGLLLAAGYVLTGELALPIGLHVAWNLFQGPVYGFAVSGVGFGVSLVDTAETGPDVMTGGAFGPEAGIIGIGAILLGFALLRAYVRSRVGTVRVDPGLTVPTLRWR